MKRVVAVLALLVSLVPLGVANADHCTNSIYLFSYNRTLQPGDAKLHSGAIACLTVGEDADSDIVYPGSDTFFVRWIIPSPPTSGTLSFAGVTTNLVFSPCLPLFGVLSRGCYDSQEIGFDIADSLIGGVAVATVCEDTDCQIHNYDTIG